VISGELVYTLSAFGALHCLDLYTGEVRWKTHLAREFGAKAPPWGYASSPLVEGDLLVINPGAPAASVVALDRVSGKVVWKTPGPPAAYAAFICGSFGGRKQIVGYDAESLGGWDIRTGARLWKLVPENRGDFNVPTPLAWRGRLVVATENNGARIYNFRKDGTIVPAPLALNPGLSPDASSPVLAGNLLIGCAGGLKALGLPALQSIWEGEAEAFANYVSLITAGDRILAMSFGGELCLLQTGPSAVRVASRLRVFEEESETYAHPALQGHSLYVRDRAAIGCLSLE
jgi:outer membrane protein assembly factor BamB